MIYLIRHTTPAVAKGVCYGQLDIDVTDSFLPEANIIRSHLPHDIDRVYTSPLIRCSKLASHLFPSTTIVSVADLMEINCGKWEGRHWDEIPAEETSPWMNDFVNRCIPGGESYVQVYERVINSFNRIRGEAGSRAIVAHGGVIRSIMAHLTDTSLADSFNAFRLYYGCVIRVDGDVHEVLSNIPTEREQHKPSKKL